MAIPSVRYFPGSAHPKQLIGIPIQNVIRGVEEIIAKWAAAEETIWVVRNFVAEGESEKTYNPRMCPWVGKVVDYDEDEDCATPYRVLYVDDGDEEWLSAEEVYNHRISAERATLLREAVSASKDSGKCSVTSADLKMRVTLSTRAGYDPKEPHQ